MAHLAELRDSLIIFWILPKEVDGQHHNDADQKSTNSVADQRASRVFDLLHNQLTHFFDLPKSNGYNISPKWLIPPSILIIPLFRLYVKPSKNCGVWLWFRRKLGNPRGMAWRLCHHAQKNSAQGLDKKALLHK